MVESIGNFFSGAANVVMTGVVKAGSAVTGYTSESIRTNFVNQLENWAKRDFIQIASGKNPTGMNDPPNKVLKPQPNTSGYTLDEAQAQIFVKHLMKKWKARNVCIVTQGPSSNLIMMIDLGEFAKNLKNALNENKFLKPYVKQGHKVRNWEDIFGFVEYDAATTSKCFQDLNGGQPIDYAILQKHVSNPLAGVLGKTVNKMYGI